MKANNGTHVFQVLDEVRVLVRDVLLHEGGSLEQLLTRLTSEFTLVFLLDVLLAGFAQLPETDGMSTIIPLSGCKTYSS